MVECALAVGAEGLVMLGFEVLEDRSCPAPLLGISLVAPDRVEPGEVFTVDVLVRDLRTIRPMQRGYSYTPEELARSNYGVGGLSLDIRWDPAALRCRAAEVTDDLPLFQRGRIDNAAGLVDELQGARMRSLALGLYQPDRFATLTFEALAGQDTPLKVSIGRGGIGMLFAGRAGRADLRIDRHMVQVGEADAVDAVHREQPAWTGPMPRWLASRPAALRRLGLR